jgi:hypothetical protein
MTHSLEKHIIQFTLLIHSTHMLTQEETTSHLYYLNPIKQKDLAELLGTTTKMDISSSS